MSGFKFSKRHLALFLTFVILLTAFSGLQGCAYRDLDLTVFYSSDLHGYVVGGSGVIGLDYVAAMRNKTPDSILLDAGDFSHGRPIATLTKGADIVELMSLSGYTAAAIGNHEFDYGVEVLYQNIDLVNNVSFLSANVYNKNGTHAFTPYIVERMDYVSVGIFGLTTLEVVEEVVPAKIESLEFHDPVLEAKNAVKELKKLGCKIIIAVTHLGTVAPSPNSHDVAKVSGIDIIIDGHSHVECDIAGGGARIVSPGYYGTSLGELKISYNRDGGIKRISNSLLAAEDFEGITPDATVRNKINEITERQNELLSEVVGYTSFDLDASFPDVRIKETNFGDLMADALRYAAGTDFAIANGGGLRATIKAGDIRVNDIFTTLPFFNLVYSKSVTGAQLKDILEHAYSALPDPAGRFAQVSGMIVKIDLSKNPGSRVTITKADGTPIDSNENYTLAINEYLGSGGDGFPHLGELPIRFQGATEDQALIYFMNNHDLSSYATINNRILFI